MKKQNNHSVKQSTRKTDKISQDNESRFRSERRQLSERILRLYNSYKFIFGFQLDLKKNIAFSTNVNFKLFQELHEKYNTAIKAVYGRLSAEQLFRVFDEDEDGYLNEDEQLLMFVIINVQLLFLYEECIFFGYYEGVRKIEQMEADLNRVITELQSTLRKNLYREQIKTFAGNKEQIESKHVSRFEKRLHDFRKFKEAKHEELQQMQMDKRFTTLLNANTKVSNFNFTKYGALQDIRIQEKFLGIFGNLEEASNLQKIYKKVFNEEQNKLSDKITQYTTKVTKNMENKFAFQNKMLDHKLSLQESTVNQEFANSRNLLLKRLGTQEAKIKKLQDHLNAVVNTNYYRQNHLNKIKAQSKLKKDVVNDVRLINDHNVNSKAYHSSVYQKYFTSTQQVKTIKETDLKRLVAFRDSIFNYKFNLRRFDHNSSTAMQRTGMPVKENSLKKINKLINSTQLEQKKENKLCLAKFYDDNLELIQETY